MRLTVYGGERCAARLLANLALFDVSQFVSHKWPGMVYLFYVQHWLVKLFVPQCSLR